MHGATRGGALWLRLPARGTVRSGCGSHVDSLLGHGAEALHELQRSRGVEARGGLVEKKEGWVGDKLRQWEAKLRGWEHGWWEAKLRGSARGAAGGGMQQRLRARLCRACVRGVRVRGAPLPPCRCSHASFGHPRCRAARRRRTPAVGGEAELTRAGQSMA
eukprot:1047749-Prymnesium_polylepis.1